MAEPFTVEHFRQWCRLLTTDAGEPLDLEPFQVDFLTDFFGGVSELLVLLPKGNGKTTLFAALAIYHCMFTPDAMVPIGAAARDQAAILYGQARGFIRRSPGLSRRFAVRDGSREIRSTTDGGLIRVFSADADTGDGILPTLALVDELHRHKSGDLYAVWRDGLDKRGGQLVTISTAGSDEDSPLGRMRSRAMKMADVVRDGAHVVARSPEFVLHEWSVPADGDLADLDLVKTANPASWITLENLQRRRDSPTTEPWQWARFACNVWQRGEDAAISAVDWSACAVPGLTIPPGADVWIGLDIGWKWDSTGIVPITVNGEHVDVGRPAVIVPPRDGTSTRAADIIDPILAMADQWNVLGVVFDRNAGGEQLAQALEESHGLSCVMHSQDPAPMSDAAMRLAEHVRTRKLRHPADDTLTAHVLAGVSRRTSGEKWRLVKAPRSGRPIDAAIALAMALAMTAVKPRRRKRTFFVR